MFQRGRIDHFAFLAASEAAFRELRGRIESEGAADGDVRDMKTAWIMGFFDPDGIYAEVIWRKPGLPDSDTLQRTDWTTVDLTDPAWGRLNLVPPASSFALLDPQGSRTGMRRPVLIRLDCDATCHPPSPE